MTMRYGIFAGHDYYPSGGWSDFKGSFDTLEDADRYALQLYDDHNDWVQIVDMNTGRWHYVDNSKLGKIDDEIS